MNSDPLTDLHLSHNHHIVHAQESAVQLFQAAFLRTPPTPITASPGARLLPPVNFPHKTSPTPHTTASSRDDESWEVRAFAEDTSSDDGLQWPPRSYSCNFCGREFGTAQALGGHMNVHRRQRALLRAASSANAGDQPPFPLDGSVYEPSGNLGSTGYCLLYPAHSRNPLTINPQRSVSQNMLHLPESNLSRTNPTSSIPLLMPLNQEKPPPVPTSLTLAPYNSSTNVRSSEISTSVQPQMEKARQNESDNQGLRPVKRAKVVSVGPYFDENKSEVINMRPEAQSLVRLSTRKEMCKQQIDLELRLGPSSTPVKPTNGL